MQITHAAVFLELSPEGNGTSRLVPTNTVVTEQSNIYVHDTLWLSAVIVAISI